MAKTKPKFSPRHLIGIEHLSQDDICAILDQADKYAALGHQPKAQNPAFNRLIAANVFMEPSTRTRMSFEIAAERLGIKPLNFEAATSSLKKGESTLDTILTIDAMKPDVMIIRQGQRGLLDEISGAVSCPLVNAGDGTGEHPTQALLDALTIRQKKGTLKGKKVVIIGDIIHSRVARSNFLVLTKMGADVFAFGSLELMPDTLPDGVKRATSMAQALDQADAVMMLRMQLERMESRPTLDGYFASFGLSREKLARAKPDVLVLHPGPINRGVEIAPEVADDSDHSVILDQVTNGVAIRMAVLDILTRPARK